MATQSINSSDIATNRTTNETAEEVITITENEDDKDNRDDKAAAGGGNATDKNQKEDSAKRKRGSVTISCRICFDSTKDEETITPCLCKGSIGKVHLSCLERWLGTTNASACELCGFRFTTVRSPMYSVCYSVYFWLFREQEFGYRRGLGMDLSIFLILTPIIVAGMYCCVNIASINNHIGDQKAASGNWTSIALTMMSFVMALGYYLWASLVLKCHGRAWYRWWQARNVVHILNIQSHPPAGRPVVTETTV